MKKTWIIVLILVVVLTGCSAVCLLLPTNPIDPSNCQQHKDKDENGLCDVCRQSLIVFIDFYSINDLHGKFVDNRAQPGVDELTTYLKNAREEDDYAFFLSAGDMWQGGAEAYLTKGQIVTDWMNALDFTSMTVGNHEFDWGSQYIKENAKTAEFPFLAINIYDRATNKRINCCDASVVVEAGDVQIGIIGAIGDCYSSIAEDKCSDVYFKTGSDLTALVKEESTRLQNQGVDFIVYVLHSDQEDYDPALSSGGYVDLVFEGHTHKEYCVKDDYGVYHLQNKGDNTNGISHVEIAINSVTNGFTARKARQVGKSQYENMEEDPLIDELLDKYKNELTVAYENLGYNKAYRDDSDIEALVAKLYYEKGIEKWGEDYDIVLGGGSFNTRSPYNLYSGNVTYADLVSILPFDNEIALCAVKGSVLRNRFFNSTSYNLYYESYGQSLKSKLDSTKTYYIIADSWTYDYLNLTVVEYLDLGVFARDLLAEYIREGGFE